MCACRCRSYNRPPSIISFRFSGAVYVSLLSKPSPKDSVGAPNRPTKTQQQHAIVHPRFRRLGENGKNVAERTARKAPAHTLVTYEINLVAIRPTERGGCHVAHRCPSYKRGALQTRKGGGEIPLSPRIILTCNRRGFFLTVSFSRSAASRPNPKSSALEAIISGDSRNFDASASLSTATIGRTGSRSC